MERSIRDVRDIFGTNELRTYEYSPRSRRRQEDFDLGHRLPAPTTTASKKSSRHRPALEDAPGPPRKSEDPAKGVRSKEYNRTLTERDIRHLERHLSMKKTIRKQVSRNLRQAFVDDPGLAPPTLSRAKLAKAEHSLLDQLRDSEPDSGHCSATDDDTPPLEPPREETKFSFWKMFSVKGRAKR